MNHPQKPSPFSFLILAFVSAVFWLLGFGIYHEAKSAVHEIEALASFIIAAILLVGAALASAIGSLRKELWEYHVGAEFLVTAEPSRVEAPSPAESSGPGPSILAPVSGFMNRIQSRPAPKSAREQLDELRAKEKELQRTKEPGATGTPA